MLIRRNTMTEANTIMKAKPGITASKLSLCTPMPLMDAVEHVESCDVAVVDEDEMGCLTGYCRMSSLIM
jgi:hypothetical protein